MKTKTTLQLRRNGDVAVAGAVVGRVLRAALPGEPLWGWIPKDATAGVPPPAVPLAGPSRTASQAALGLAAALGFDPDEVALAP